MMCLSIGKTFEKAPETFVSRDAVEKTFWSVTERSLFALIDRNRSIEKIPITIQSLRKLLIYISML